MRISKIKIKSEITKSVNLKEIDLTKKPLGAVVALVGKNGSGKSRILNFVENYPQKINYENYFEGHFELIPDTILNRSKQNIDSAKSSYNSAKRISSNDPNYQAYINQSIKSFQYFENNFKNLYKPFIKKIDNDKLQEIKSGINNNILTFEKILSNQHFDNYLANPNEIVNNQPNNNILLNEINQFNNTSTTDYLKKLSIDIVTNEFNLFVKNRNDLNTINTEIKKNKSFQLFSKFQEYVKQFLGKEFSYKQDTKDTTIDSILHFNEHPFNINLLSPGQKTLFAYAILFFYLDVNSRANINESIIIIDEPEKHLHPEAQIQLIDAIKSIIKDKGQLWIATHSVHILSHLEFDEILMVKDDEIIHPSRTTPGKSFNDLMGIEGHIDELSTFINSISEWAYANFMTQCFIEPDVVFGNNIDDPQFKLFKEFLIKKNNINLLDYGAGKGRIGYTIKEDEESNKKVSYSAFEPEKENLKYQENLTFLKAVPNISNIYSEMNEIPKEQFDCVLLCNVLHEIIPEKWVEIFENIKRILKSDGYLLIIEDKFLPKGENANDYGYLILGTEETKKLLRAEEIVELKLKEKELSERILFNAFTQDQINPSIISVIDSLESLNKISFKRIKALRKDMKKTSDVNVGRKYANETQLYINSTLALENLKIIKSKSATIEKV